MPLYDYRCVSCKKEFEVFYKSQSAVKEEEPKELCPHCGSRIKERVVSKGTSHIFKSGKWFKQGY